MNVTEKQLESLKKLLQEWEFQGGKDELLFIERDALQSFNDSHTKEEVLEAFSKAIEYEEGAKRN